MQTAESGLRTQRTVAILSLLFVLYCVVLAVKSHAGFPTSVHMKGRWPWLADRPFGEDGYYMLTVAYNLASLRHLVYTYNMPATGIQPLSTLVFAGIAFLVRQVTPDRWLLVRILIFFGSLLFVLFCGIMGYVSAQFVDRDRKANVFLIGFALTLFDFTLFRLFTYGLETGIYLCLLAVCFLIWHKIVSGPGATWSQMIWLGLAGGVAGLARIDFGICFSLLLGYLLITRRSCVVQVLCAGVLALIVVSPWFLFVHGVSGHWLPSSSGAESAVIDRSVAGHRLELFALSLIAHAAPWSFAGSKNLPTTLVGLVSILFLVWLARSARGTRDLWDRSASFRASFLPWIAAFLLLSVVYLVFFWATHFYVRYFAPLAVFFIPLLAVALSELTLVQRRVQFLVAALAVLFCVWDVAAFHTGKIYATQVLSASYVHNWYPDEHVGAFQSGTLGYYNPNVENLDGKLNQGALLATKVNQLPKFIDKEGIQVLIDWPYYIERLPEAYREREWEPCPHPTYSSDSICLIRKGAR